MLRKGMRLWQGDVLSPSQDKTLNIFLVTVLGGTFAATLGIVLYYVYAFAASFGGSREFDWLLGIFSDFVEVMSFSLAEDPYAAAGSSYPPMAIIVLFPFALICRDVFALYEGEGLDVITLTSRIVLHAEFWIALVLFFALCSVAIIAAIAYEYRLSPKDTLKVALITLLSSPFIYVIMRGNTIYFALIFILLFLILHKSTSALARELGYVFLVLAGLIKIYPLIFGIFVLHKKRICAAVRIAAYTALCLTVFFFVLGTSDDLGKFLQNLSGFASNLTRLTSGNNLSLTSLLCRTVFATDLSAENEHVFAVINYGLIALIFVLAAVLGTLTRDSLSRAVIAVSSMILIPPVSYFYVLVFMIIPFMEFIKRCDVISKCKKNVYTVLFLVIFFAPLLLFKDFTAQTLAVMSMLLLECASVIKREILPRIGNKKDITQE